MKKYQRAIENLTKNGTHTMKVYGNSMLPIIKSGSTLTYVSADEYKVGDIVFCKVRGRYIDAHKIIKKNDEKGYQIANNRGHINGWTKTIYGKVIL